MRLISIIIVFFSFILSATAQSNVTTLREINKIKRDSTYLYAESTVKDWESAYYNAKVNLTEEIENFLISTTDSSTIKGVIAKVQDHIYEIKSTRGPLYRAFVYVKKSDILMYKDKSKIMVYDIPESDSLKVHSSIDKGSLITEEPTKIPLSSIERKMLNITTCDEVKSFFTEEKQNGKISDFGKYTEMPTDSPVYLFIYNKDFNVIAYLKVDNGNAINLATGKKDSISNYNGQGGVWFQTY